MNCPQCGQIINASDAAVCPNCSAALDAASRTSGPVVEQAPIVQSVTLGEFVRGRLRDAFGSRAAIAKHWYADQLKLDADSTADRSLDEVREAFLKSNTTIDWSDDDIERSERQIAFVARATAWWLLLWITVPSTALVFWLIRTNGPPESFADIIPLAAPWICVALAGLWAQALFMGVLQAILSRVMNIGRAAQ